MCVPSVWTTTKKVPNYVYCRAIMVSFALSFIPSRLHLASWTFSAYHMKCIDPWLLNNRRQCPVCKRYVFLDRDNSDAEENNSETVSERTPLLQPADETAVAVLPRDRPHGKIHCSLWSLFTLSSVSPVIHSM